MYTKAAREGYLKVYAGVKYGLSSKWLSLSCSHVCIGFFRFQYPLDYERPQVKTPFPGP